MSEKYPEFSDLIGKTITKIEVTADKENVNIECSDGEKYRMYHSQDCCETVSVDDVVGDLEDLVGSPITQAEEVSHRGGDENLPEECKQKSDYEESFTWTFYKLATIKGSVTIKWYGSSNGYYSESVDFDRVDKHHA